MPMTIISPTWHKVPKIGSLDGQSPQKPDREEPAYPFGELATPVMTVGPETMPPLAVRGRFGFLSAASEAGIASSAGRFMASTISTRSAWYSPVACCEGASLVAGESFSDGAGSTGAGSIAPGSKRTLCSFSPTNQTQRMPVILSSSKISVLTVSTVMVGPPDLSTTRSPDLKMVIARIYCHQSESVLSQYQIAATRHSRLERLSMGSGQDRRLIPRSRASAPELPGQGRNEPVRIRFLVTNLRC